MPGWCAPASPGRCGGGMYMPGGTPSTAAPATGDAPCGAPCADRIPALYGECNACDAPWYGLLASCEFARIICHWSALRCCTCSGLRCPPAAVALATAAWVCCPSYDRAGAAVLGCWLPCAPVPTEAATATPLVTCCIAACACAADCPAECAPSRPISSPPCCCDACAPPPPAKLNGGGGTMPVAPPAYAWCCWWCCKCCKCCWG
mmetsp:Transcript_10858/g.45015  ORF Transcript_10858/g.45015 Transcript_10858/m.45015 type:complete len:205 (-) Transcript_10858:435-1049(-)